MTVQGHRSDQTTTADTPLSPGRTPARHGGRTVRPGRGAPVHDLRAGHPARELRYPAGDLVVASGLPGSGKSTLMKRTVAGLDLRGGAVCRVDSQDTRERWQRRLPDWLPYVVYRPLVRCAHYARLRRAVRSGASVVVHDCGQLVWVRRWLARRARRQGRRLHAVLLDVSPAVALAGQSARGRAVSGYAFGRHRRAMARLFEEAEAGRPPRGCSSAVLLDRAAVDALETIGFD
ncbi:ATP-binding protein [Streptomyces sp. SAJ15]|nr:ATP-binding protein [Streptomyces sp. SAJ15]TVL94545.1 ATP-binding protein [Streptomyces sp. SAJ15]